MRATGFGRRLGIPIIVTLLLGAGLVAQQRSSWKPGEFRGLIAGKSSRKDVIRVLGATTPKTSENLDIYSYPGKGDFGANIMIEVNHATGMVQTITERFSPNITRTQARKKYGERYNEVQYSIAECPYEGVNAPAYRDPNGPIGLIEYPQQGLVLWPNKEGFDIAAALYLAKPLPRKKPVCSKR